MTKVLVAGGAGYVGSVLVEKLLNEGYSVCVVDNLSRRANHAVGWVSRPNFRFYLGDVTSEEDMTAVLKDYKPDVIINLAAIVGAPICDRFKKMATEVNQAKHLARYARINKVAYFLASTGSVYGDLGPGVICKEDIPPKPISHYAVTKLAAENFLEEVDNAFVFRFSTACGVSPNPRLNLLPNDFAWQAVHNNSLVVFQADFKRSFINVADMAESFIHAIKNYNLFYMQPYRLFNVGDEEASWSKRELAEAIKELTGCSVFYGSEGYVDPDQRNYVIDFSRIKSLGWSPKISMKTGLEQLVASAKILDHKPKFD